MQFSMRLGMRQGLFCGRPLARLKIAKLVHETIHEKRDGDAEKNWAALHLLREGVDVCKILVLQHHDLGIEEEDTRSGVVDDVVPDALDDVGVLHVFG